MLKPPLKWVGGKTQILDKITELFPSEMNHYHEIFLGGGSVLLALLTLIQQGKITVKGEVHAYDKNPTLIALYQHIQQRPDELYGAIHSIVKTFYTCPEKGEINRHPKQFTEIYACRENYYYWMRNIYNETEKTTLEACAMFIFLNKTCFRGLYRVGPHGFNVPYGHYKHPEVIDREHLYQIHALIQGVHFECCDFTTSIGKVLPGDFMYLDPPYMPEKDTSFVGYTEGGFSIEQHEQLFKLLHETAAPFLMSNADVNSVKQHFNGDDGKYRIQTVSCRRRIHSKNPESCTNELLICKT